MKRTPEQVIWDFVQIPFPKTHDIQDLLKLAARVDATLERELSSAAMVTPFGVEFRYPGDETADRETAQQALDEAERVQAGVLSRLRSYLDQGHP
jgi:HEPN domain-containing protein